VLRRRCPHCGRAPVTRSWFAAHARCAACGLRFQRGRDESHDYWLGAYTLNFILTELVFALALLVALVLTWPEPPWRTILYGGALLMIVTPILLYPWSRTLWLAIDLVFRPVEPDDFGADEPDDDRAGER
jgi:uncharacterized protein (DUF983 family)